MLENYMSPFDATVVERIQEAGLVCTQCRDAVMGVHSYYRANYPVFA